MTRVLLLTGPALAVLPQQWMDGLLDRLRNPRQVRMDFFFFFVFKHPLSYPFCFQAPPLLSYTHTSTTLPSIDLNPALRPPAVRGPGLRLPRHRRRRAAQRPVRPPPPAHGGAPAPGTSRPHSNNKASPSPLPSINTRSLPQAQAANPDWRTRIHALNVLRLLLLDAGPSREASRAHMAPAMAVVLQVRASS